MEKSVTLSVARAVRDRLRNKHGLRVVLTRSDDRFVTLVGRRAVAEANHADLFLSIHADSAPDPSARGASIYTLREDGRPVVVSRIARTSSYDGVAGRLLDPDVASILGDLRQRDAMNDSAGFAVRLAADLAPVIAMRSQPRLSAHFAVLKAEGIPRSCWKPDMSRTMRTSMCCFRRAAKSGSQGLSPRLSSKPQMEPIGHRPAASEDTAGLSYQSGSMHAKVAEGECGDRREPQSYLGLASKGPPDSGLDKLASPGPRSDPTPRRAVVRDMDSRCLPTHTMGEGALAAGRWLDARLHGFAVNEGRLPHPFAMCLRPDAQAPTGSLATNPS